VRFKRLPETILLSACLLIAVTFFAQARKATGERRVQGARAADNLSAPEVPKESVTEKELETVRDYDQRLLSTVHWALGGVFLLVALVGGLNWFTNYRLYERERDALRESSKLAAHDEAVKLRAMFNELRDGAAKDSAQLGAQVRSIEASVGEAMRLRDERLRKEIKDASDSLGRSFQHDLAMAEYENTKVRAAYYLAAKSIVQCLESWGDYLGILQKLGWLDEHFLGAALTGIEQALSQSSAIPYATHSKIVQYLDKAPELMASRVAKIKGQMDALRHILARYGVPRTSHQRRACGADFQDVASQLADDRICRPLAASGLDAIHHCSR